MPTKSEYLQIRVTPAQKKRLRRLAKAAGTDLSAYVLARAAPSGQKRFEELVTLLAGKEVDRYALAELNDLLSTLGTDELGEAVAVVDLSALSPVLRNYVAAMVEQACSMKGIRPPGWTARVRPLEAPWFAAPLHSLRLHLLKASPVPYKRRNLFVDAGVGARV
jgi:uncharacterized protein (DUF1778 family)